MNKIIPFSMAKKQSVRRPSDFLTMRTHPEANQMSPMKIVGEVRQLQIRLTLQVPGTANSGWFGNDMPSPPHP